MKKSAITVMPEYYDKYILPVDDINVVDALKKYDVSMFDKATLARIGINVYEPGKWTVKDIIQHVIDAERVFSYRALRFARNDKTALPGFEENEYAVNTNVAKRSLDDLLSEFETVRRSTIFLYKNFTDEMLQRAGVASGRDISVLAIGFIIAGHALHHSKVIKERYYNISIKN
jgi:hypothetical protein